MSSRALTGRRLTTLGLRARLLLAFTLVNIVAATAVAGVGYVRARDAIVERAQETIVIETTGRAEALYPLPSSPPGERDLVEIAGAVSGRDGTGLAENGGASAGGFDPSIVSAELRAVVRSGRTAWQRVNTSDGVQLVIGMQLRLTTISSDTTTRPSGTEVYVLHPFDDEAAVVDGLARDAWLTGTAGLVLALLLALLSARSVLRPVRELRVAAHRLGTGDLEARVTIPDSRDELAEVARTFNETATALRHHVGELRRMEADARRFVADVSHELRTPLAAMTAVTDVLADSAGNLPGVTGEAVRLIDSETRNLTRLVEDLIEVTRFDSGTATLTLDEVDVAATVATTLAVRGFDGEVSADLPDGIIARLDPRRLDVIVANLVGNAIRHGGPPVALRLSTDRGVVVIEVSDAGPGLGADVARHVFDRFYKADPARSRSEGSGLGLAIARENAQLHGGTLTAADRPEGGALFTLRLQLDPDGGR